MIHFEFVSHPVSPYPIDLNSCLVEISIISGIRPNFYLQVVTIVQVLKPEVAAGAEQGLIVQYVFLTTGTIGKSIAVSLTTIVISLLDPDF